MVGHQPVPKSDQTLYPGLRVGSVELVREVDPREIPSLTTPLRQWEVLCDCGTLALRTANYLVQALRKGTNTCCGNCRWEYYERLKQGSNKWYLVEYFRRTGSLYPPSRPEVNYDPARILESTGVDSFSLNCRSYETNESPNLDYPQQDQWLVPLVSKSGLICYYCGKPFIQGCGCVRCLTRICSTCALERSHRCPLNWMDTWKDESKDQGLLARRTALLLKTPLVPLTQELVNKNKENHLREYQRWLKAQEKARLKKARDDREALRLRYENAKRARRKAQKDKREHGQECC